jgi:hypothetical protein
MEMIVLSNIEVPGKRNVGWLSKFAARNDGNEVWNRMAGVLLPCMARFEEGDEPRVLGQERSCPQ